MKYTVKSTTYGTMMTFDNEHDAMSAMNTYNWATENDRAYIEKEEDTMENTTKTTQKGLTYEQFQKLAMKHYNHGGDDFVECWDEKMFNDYVNEFGPVTVRKALEMFGFMDEVDTEERKAAEFFSGMSNNTTTENTKEDTTMKTTFTLINGLTYTMNPQTNRYSKSAMGKTVRIGKAEYEEAKRTYNYETIKFSTEDEQAELDKEPCFVDPVADLYTPAVIDENGCVDCRECNVKECVHRNCMRRNPKNVGGLGECPRLDVKPQQEEPDEVQDPELDQIMQETGLEASDAELERNIRNEHKKLSKPRKSKDIAYEGSGATLTAKQVDFLRELRETETYKEDENDMVIEDITVEIGGQFEDKPMTVGAMISTLCEKHLGTRIKAKVGNRTMTLFGLTLKGKEIMNAIK